MGVGDAKRGAISGEKIAEGGGEEFSSVVALHTLDGDVKLSKDISVEAMYYVNGVGLVAQRECPTIQE